MIEVYDEDYFLRGKETGKSLYENYRFLPELTRPMVASMVSHLGIKHGQSILDFGCARGYTVRAFREMEYEAYGCDVSEWATANADDNVRNHVGSPEWALDNSNYDWIIAKDVLEHVKMICHAIEILMDRAKVGIFVVVPLSLCDNQHYVCDDYEKDMTHVHRMTLPSWINLFLRPGWGVHATYRLPWIKQNWYKPGWERGNGFLTIRREG